VSKARVVITAVVVEGRSTSEVARAYGLSKSWVCELVARYRSEGESAFEPRSRRPKTSPTAISQATVELIVELRRRLVEAGLDAGAETIRWHLEHHHSTVVSRATIDRTLHREGLVTPAPKKRPRSSFVRFAAEQPNEMWQSDFTHYALVTNEDCEILSWLDDHARLAVSVTAHIRVTGPVVVETFRAACARYGVPAATLTDNGMVFTTRLAGGRGGRNAFESELRRLGIEQKNSRPNHPTTCGKVERFQQTMKAWLRAQARQPATVAELQLLCDRFVQLYNHERPHSSLQKRMTPAAAYDLRPKATPGDRSNDCHWRVRHDRVDKAGRVTLRHNGRLHHIGLGYEHARARVVMLIADLHVRVVDADTGELLRDLVLDPTKDYQKLNRPPGPRRRERQRPEPS
jgi:transposase InsO family protein